MEAEFARCPAHIEYVVEYPSAVCAKVSRIQSQSYPLRKARRLPVLDPGRGRTKTGRLWVYARDDRPRNGPDPPAVYLYSPDRRAERPASHLTQFTGAVQVDGYPGFERLRAGGVQLAEAPRPRYTKDWGRADGTKLLQRCGRAHDARPHAAQRRPLC
jgi:hypothetical protein